MSASNTFLIVSLAGAFGIGWLARGTWRTEAGHKHPAEVAQTDTVIDDATLIHTLLAQDLGSRKFPFSEVVHATSGKRLHTLDMANPAHTRIVAAIHRSLADILPRLSQAGSPVRSKCRRINEASRFFEDDLIASLSATPGLSCESPRTRDGEHQRAGYPDLRITDTATGTVIYLDPKLVEQGTAESTFRTFYFEPKNQTLKINDDAVHLIVGIEHDGKSREWTFSGWRLIDLSALQCRMKAEFQASNADLYDGSALHTPGRHP